ncbi:hypothetical protein WCLE_006630 [Wolbachia endosymbiont of Cimex lectularius]|nr:hypothetical protein WCLE_006630 [Wolbachia endosymbiont of Cimex lectularius]
MQKQVVFSVTTNAFIYFSQNSKKVPTFLKKLTDYGKKMVNFR